MRKFVVWRKSSLSRWGHYIPRYCRAAFGDERCGFPIEVVTAFGSVTASEGQAAFTDSTRSEANGYFSFGKVTFVSGDNAGLSMEVKEFRAKRFALALPMPYAISPGDTYTAVMGCDKRFFTCASVFANGINFQGEPHVPGMDKALETAGTRSG